MTPVHAIMVLIIRLWAAGVIISMLASIPFYALSVFSENGARDTTTLGVATNAVVWLIAGVIGWIFAPALVKAIKIENPETGVKVDISAEQLVMIGCFLIGGFYLVEYLPNLVYRFLRSFAEQSQLDTSFADGGLRRRMEFQEFIKELMIVGASVWLMLWPAPIVKIFSSLRTAGLSKTAKE